MKKTFTLLILAACQLSFGAELFCDGYSGPWWKIGYEAWILTDYSFSNECQKISVSKTSQIEIQTYSTASDWTLVDRWKAEADQEYYSLYGWIYWHHNELISKSRLYRDRDLQLAWDFTSVKTFNRDEMVEGITRVFPIEGHTYKFQYIWTRKGP